MHHRSQWLAHTLLATSICLLWACGDDTGAAAGDAGAAGAGAGASGSGGSAGSDMDASASGSAADASAVTCTATTTDVTSPVPSILSNLSVAGSKLVFLSSDPSLAEAPKIMTVDAAGGDPTELFTSSGMRRIRSLFAVEDHAYFLEENEDVVPAYELFRLPLAGGSPAAIGTASFPSGYIFAVDATYVYVVRNTDQPVGAVFDRVKISDGAIDRVATIEGIGTPFHVRMDGDDVFFVAGFAGSRADEPLQVYGFKKTAADVTPDTLWAAPTMNDPCYMPLGGVIATPSKLACGYASVAVRGRDGSAPETLITNAIPSGDHVLVATDAENLYLIERVGPGADPGLMNRLPSAGGSLTPVVCDLGTVANQVADGFFPIQNEYEVVMSDTSVIWVEERLEGSNNVYLLRSAPK